MNEYERADKIKELADRLLINWQEDGDFIDVMQDLITKQIADEDADLEIEIITMSREFLPYSMMMFSDVFEFAHLIHEFLITFVQLDEMMDSELIDFANSMDADEFARPIAELAYRLAKRIDPQESGIAALIRDAIRDNANHVHTAACEADCDFFND
jgi:hypothetical protein